MVEGSLGSGKPGEVVSDKWRVASGERPSFNRKPKARAVGLLSPRNDHARDNCRDLAVGHVSNVPGTMESCPTYCFLDPKPRAGVRAVGLDWATASVRLS